MQFSVNKIIKSVIVSAFIASTAFAGPITNYPSELVFLEHWNGLGDSGVNMVDYLLVIDANKRGVLTVQGFMVYQVMNVILQDTVNETSVFFNSYAEDNQGVTYHTGDKLFEIDVNGNQVSTIWDKLAPVLPQHQNTGMYFQYKRYNATP